MNLQIAPDWLRHVIQFLIQLGPGYCILLFFTELAKRKRGEEFTGMFLLSSVMASAELRLGFVLIPGTEKIPYLWIFFFSSLLALGPTLLLVSGRMLRFTLEKTIPLRRHFFPAYAAILLELFFFLAPLESKAELIEDAFLRRSRSPVALLIGIGYVHLTFYCFYSVRLFRKSFREIDVRLSRSTFWILLVTMSSIQLSGIGFYFHADWLFACASILMTLGNGLVFVFSARYPNFFVSLKSEIQQKRYEKTQLGGINLDAIRFRLKELMEEERSYRNEDLRMQDLAEKLLITPHQISRILNESYGKNFNEFVNGYRVEEAKKILLEEPTKTVLSIGFEVGFNTKSTFNAQFLKITGMTPAEWRKKI
ncbi:AraC family transcriptional regulator [Leptospira gomenensis]|uniref:AraC family transcriptional regulator n=1 Tax=Leptospira gomenensis TaxID=2484974 RepID=A0A5F1YFN1_9LEPT|nr:helix-turn-helix domain-containing protein [Leptospira gomenensis]TGK39197.1 AraC family transcriptional regulator [Leptospira gomenensis]TGK44262.1 AraC family transcriptional regulator [Leptospira gomenensis]TGK45068.1 AraC family transcriptional regulator [Leptospira gomenensis]TGK65124.1 AraC family transcriptional regulator [Leptospira gomenensis]